MPPAAQVKSVPVYDVSNYGTDKFIPLIETLDMGTFTQSGLDEIKRTLEDGNIPVDDVPQIISNLDEIPYYDHGTDDEAYDRTYSWRPDMTAMVYKITLNMAFVMDMTAWTSNEANFTGVKVTFSEGPDGKVLYSNIFKTGLADQGQVGASLYILHADVAVPFKVYSAQAISIRVQTTFTQTATNTIRFGMVPFFATTADNYSKFFSQSGVVFHIHASLDHATPIFRADHPLINHIWQNVGHTLNAVTETVRSIPQRIQGRYNT